MLRLKIDGDVWVSLGAISKLFGATVARDDETNTVAIDLKDIEAQKSQILLLEQALVPKDPFTAVKTWAEGVKMRNGAVQYAVMSPKLKRVL
jgi:hypothetical protein